MKVAITGGTGFVGSNLSRRLEQDGHTVIACSRRTGLDLQDPDGLAREFAGCDVIVHCAGINRELGNQTYERVHVNGTRNVVDAAKRMSIPKIILLSFLRARPDCGSPYHESKWAAEEIVRGSGITHVIVKAGVVYGRGDHMLDHLSHALYTFPLFGLVGIRSKPVRPLAVADLVEILRASVVSSDLDQQTVPAIGPEQLTLEQAVRRVAAVVDRNPWFVRLPVWFHYGLGWLFERIMRIPLVSLAQVRILSEGIVTKSCCEHELPAHLTPKRTFDPARIARGLPEEGRFTLADLRCPCRTRV